MRAATLQGRRARALSLIGFVENRYVLELYPIVLVLAGIGLSRPGAAAAALPAQTKFE